MNPYPVSFCAFICARYANRRTGLPTGADDHQMYVGVLSQHGRQCGDYVYAFTDG
ncbi:MAG: hypothetical protein H8E81_02205 [Deltaproteobacteria bacterium]|nr:hypothetical protein [Deltaproteobacteria bacterium]